MYSMASYDEETKNAERQTDESRLYKSPIQILKEDPNIRIVTDVPGLSWHIEYKVPPKEKRKGNLFRQLFSRTLGK